MTQAPDFARNTAYVHCTHGRLQDKPCGRCLTAVARRIARVDPALLQLTAQKLVDRGFPGCPPTSLDYLAALDLLEAILPVARRVGALD